MRTSVIIVCLLAWLAPASGKKATAKGETSAKADCSSADAQIAKLTAEVESLRKQLSTASGTCSSNQEFSVVDALSKSSSFASDVVTHLLQQTDLDDKVVSAVSAQVEAAGALHSELRAQIAAHPCSSDYNECIKTVTSSPLYMTHLAAHVDALIAATQPHVESLKPHIDTAFKSAKTAYGSAVEMAGVVAEKSSAASDRVSTLAGAMPDQVNSALDPAFAALQQASPQHHHVLPKKSIDRVLLICLVIFLIDRVLLMCLVIVRLGIKVFVLGMKLGFGISIKLPFKIAKMTASWSFFFCTGFYVCGLCRKRKTAEKKTGKQSADAKSSPKKSSKPATEKDLIQLLEKAKEKNKFNDGVSRLVEKAKSGKPLQEPEEMKGKEIKKDVLKKALAKYKEVDMKKLGL